MPKRILIADLIDRLHAEVANDRDVAYGAPVTGAQLDFFEAVDRELTAAFKHQLIYGEWAGSPTLEAAKSRRPTGQAIFVQSLRSQHTAPNSSETRLNSLPDLK